MAELPIRKPSGDTEAIVPGTHPGPNAADYPHLQCPNDYPHEFQVDLGDANPFHVASIQMVAMEAKTGTFSSTMCPRRGAIPSRVLCAQWRTCGASSISKWGFRPLNNKLHHLWDLIMKTRDALAAISGEQFPPLPPKTAEITLKGKGKESTSAWPRRSTTPLFDEDVGVKYNEDGLIPDLNVLETVLPTGGQLLHIVIYYEWRTLPLHTRSTWLAALWFVVAPTSLKTGCVWLNRWTQRARDQAAAAASPAALQHKPIGATATEASELDKKRKMVPHSVGGTPEAAGPSKRRRNGRGRGGCAAPHRVIETRQAEGHLTRKSRRTDSRIRPRSPSPALTLSQRLIYSPSHPLTTWSRQT
ncbi:hypothetical protein DFH06DRAFT_1139024 [Mycena polygramma]|nr:hypothetical protein DFH06DRAFT_1139024 [Mycena polygramma]